MSKTLSAAMLVSLVGLAVSAQALDYWGGPSTWDRGDEGSTYQEWTFDVPFNSTPEAGFINPNGMPSAYLRGPAAYVTVEGPAVLGGQVSGITHQIPGSSFDLALEVPNFAAVNPTKYIFLQVTASAPLNGVVIDPNATLAFDENNAVIPVTVSTWDTGVAPIVDLGMGWAVYTFGFEITPNPFQEHILLNLGENVVVDQVVLDTICVPEPASLSLIGLGALVFFRRR